MDVISTDITLGYLSGIAGVVFALALFMRAPNIKKISIRISAGLFLLAIGSYARSYYLQNNEGADAFSLSVYGQFLLFTFWLAIIIPTLYFTSRHKRNHQSYNEHKLISYLFFVGIVGILVTALLATESNFRIADYVLLIWVHAASGFYFHAREFSIVREFKKIVTFLALAAFCGSVLSLGSIVVFTPEQLQLVGGLIWASLLTFSALRTQIFSSATQQASAPFQLPLKFNFLNKAERFSK